MPQNKTQIQDLLLQAKSQEKAFVMYKLPGTADCILQTGIVSAVSNIPADENGFVIFPFHDEENGFFITQEIIKTFRLSELSFPDPSYYFSENNKVKSADEAEFCELVDKALYEIRKENLRKVVLSRANKVLIKDDFSLLKLFTVLAENYNSAFVYLLSAPQIGTWIGATPELLLEKEGNMIRTMALAGTIRNNKNNPGTEEETASFTSKEIEEQRLVTDYIKDIISKFTDEVKISGPELRQAGNISHLVTNFKASLKSAETGYLAQIASSLHPTPAICGIPKEKALKFILANEGYNRSFYSGFLGPLTKQGNADFFVNLRCMQVFEKSAVLYAGAGIVDGSVPQKEWQETAQKMNTLLQYIPTA